MNLSNNQSYRIPLFWIGFHVVLAIAAVNFQWVAMLWGRIPLILGCYFIIKHKDKGAQAALWAGYYAALEVSLKITQGEIGSEVVKYVVMFFLLLGESFVAHRKRYYVWLFAIALLLPSSFLLKRMTAEYFETLRFTLSGILTLLVAAFYFSGRIMNKYTYIKLLSWILLPLLSLTLIITLKTPDFSEMTFVSGSNSATTGGFGPVHVSVVLGCGLLIIALLTLLKQGVVYNIWGNFIFLFFIAMRSLLTFSRSGLFAFLGAFAAAILVSISSRIIKQSSVIVLLGVFALLSVVIWVRVDQLTGGMAYNRYSGKNSAGEQQEDISTGRSELFQQEIEMFLQSPIVGVGAGNVLDVRLDRYNDFHSSHTEYSRLLAEHGILGLGVVLILIGFPLGYFKNTRNWTRLFFVAFMLYSLLSMLPAATRTSLPLLFYGLAFIKIYEDYYLDRSRYEKRLHV